jgi:hypothetical protein
LISLSGVTDGRTGSASSVNPARKLKDEVDEVRERVSCNIEFEMSDDKGKVAL